MRVAPPQVAIQALIKAGADCNRGDTVETPLHRAIQTQDSAVVALLLPHAHIDAENTNGVRPVWYAIGHDAAIMHQLIVAGVCACAFVCCYRAWPVYKFRLVRLGLVPLCTGAAHAAGARQLLLLRCCKA